MSMLNNQMVINSSHFFGPRMLIFEPRQSHIWTQKMAAESFSTWVFVKKDLHFPRYSNLPDGSKQLFMFPMAWNSD